jgi:cell wall-associated NlpC family hydrolase
VQGTHHGHPPLTRVRLRGLVVLLACVGLAGVSLAAASGKKATDPGAAVVAAAKGHLGDTYTWGSTGPTTWDCSGLTSTLWREVGGVTAIPRVSRDQQKWAIPLPAEQVRTGDLVFFGDPVTHVGLVDERRTAHGTTTVTMVDASMSQKGVVQRPVWTSGIVRFGRVPRKGMVAVTAWTPPALPSKPAPQHAPNPSAPTPPTPAPAAQPHNAGATPPATKRIPGTPVANKAVRLARSYLGSSTISDLTLVRTSWFHAGGSVLPASQDGLLAAGRRVALRDARVGDLVSYGAPYAHVGLYVGNGRMVDASRSLGKVVERPVWASPTLLVYRLLR